jgi:acyl-homoserine-lactone acylase
LLAKNVLFAAADNLTGIPMFRRAAILTPALFALVLAACGPRQDTSNPTASMDPRYNADIRWTSYGIPHVKADDWGSLGYGFAYATAKDGVCVFARHAVMANGTLAADMGPSPENIASDGLHRALISEDSVRRYEDGLTDNTRAFNQGFIAGYNRYLRDNADTLPAGCAGEKWLRPLNQETMARMTAAFGIRYGLGTVVEGIAAASPPGEPVARVALDLDATPALGSNALALGKDITESGRGILFGNPHYPWEGPARFHMIHTTIPGVVNTMGVSLLASNFIVIGYNEDVAWTHTVSTAMRFTLFELELNPDNPMQYRYGDSFRDLEKRTVAVPVGADGNTGEVVERTIYLSHFGPILESEQLPWTQEKAYVIRDAIQSNNASPATYEAMLMAESVGDVEAAISRQGALFVNTIAADRHGNAFYADISATPNVTAEMLRNCRKDVAGLPPQLLVLDGTDSACEWVVDPRSNIPGNMPADDMPRATSTRYFANSNDSYWLSNPETPLEGYSPTIGPERTARRLRTRAGLTYLNEQLQQSEKLTPASVRNIIYNHRHFGAELLLDDVLTTCDEDDAAIAESCEVLSGWDRTGNTDSRGMQVWTAFWENARNIPNLYAIPFDPADPVNTPRGIAVDVPDVRAAIREELAKAQASLQEAGIELDAPWGEVQFTNRNGKRIPVPGGPGRHGMFSYINTGFTPGEGYTPIVAGNSYIQVVTWDESGAPDASGILTYSQSPEPDSPHYADQTQLYADGEWVDLPFTEEEILGDPNLVSLTLSE